MIGAQVLEIGTDHHLVRGEAVAGGRVVSTAAWAVYRDGFGGFCRAHLDPQFASLDSPVRSEGLPRVAPGTTVVIAGHDGDAARRAGDLRHVRRHVSLWTSAQGAEALADRDVTPDLMIAQHRSDLGNALHVRHVTDRDGCNVLGTSPVVLADRRLPAVLLAGVPDGRLLGADAAYGWGWWPATLVSLALQTEASAIVLTGVDLDRVSRAPLAALLALLATDSPLPLIAADTPAPSGWVAARLRDTPGPGGTSEVAVTRTVGATRDSRLAALAVHLDAAADALRAAEGCRAQALEARRRPSSAGDARLESAWQQMLAWGRQRELRVAMQDGLGVQLLPRMWRQEAAAIPGPLWRPVLLIADELLRQGARARARLDAREERHTA